MRPLALLVGLALPVLAGTPLQVKVHVASLVIGSGREPLGPMPPSRFNIEVSFSGGPKALRPEFRVWRLQEKDRIALERGASPKHLRQGQAQVEAQTQALPEGHWLVSGTWPEARQDEERLLLEVWQGKRRLAWVLTPLRTSRRPEAPSRPDGSEH